MRKKVLALFVGLFVVTAASAISLDEVTVGYGKSRDWATVTRVGLRSDWPTWLNGWATGFWELSGNSWAKDGDNIYGVALSPVFVLQAPRPVFGLQPYIDGGIGATLISQTKLRDRDMSSLYQFEDRIGAGVRMGHVDLHFGYMHYSNANLVKPNQGIDIYLATLGYSF